MRKLPKAVVVVGLSFFLLPLVGACGGGTSLSSPSSQSTPSSSSSGQSTGYLTALHGLELRKGQPANVEFRVTSEAVDILVVVANPLSAFRLQRVVTPPPSPERNVGAPIPLQGKKGVTGGGVTSYLMATPKLRAGWYRFEFTGEGRVLWLAVVEH